ncbi:MAG: class B sortase [Bacteroidales bacterium]|nr:class B sortase [Bacteroidales bacterium]MCM1415046.1 class B sortase [bacterium]MCM1422900.1 class B sortase [bacterium]
MKGKKKVLFSAQRRVMRRRVAVWQHILTVLLLVCGAYLLWYRWDSSEAAKKNRELRRIAWQETEAATAEAAVGQEPGDADAAQEPQDADAAGKTGGAEEAASGEMTGFDALLQINGDLKGWISIPGTTLSLPVVQGKDNEWYLTHDFYGKQDRHGTIFADCGADLAAGEPNVVLYGHHMRDGSMFGILKEYRAEEFYKEHPSFYLYLPDGEREYEVFAVLRNDIFEGNGDPFQYYDYKKIKDEETFAEYCGILAENALYDTDVEVQAGDELVTLCTCDYGSEDQRLLVVGRRK